MHHHEHLQDIIQGFDNAMLVTCPPGGHLHARPMRVAAVEGESETYFATSIDSPKVAEIEADARVLLTFQGRAQFATVEGHARIVRDRNLIDRLWSSEWQVWFPGGKDDPSLCLIKVEPTSAEFWDNSGVEGVKYLFEGAKAVAQGRRPEMDQDQHAKVEF